MIIYWKEKKKVKFNILWNGEEKKRESYHIEAWCFFSQSFIALTLFLTQLLLFFVDTHTFGALNYEFLSRIFMSWMYDMGWKQREWMVLEGAWFLRFCSLKWFAVKLRVCWYTWIPRDKAVKSLSDVIHFTLHLSLSEPL